MAFSENWRDFINPDTPGYTVAQISNEDVEIIFDNGYDEEFNTACRNPVATVADVCIVGLEAENHISINSLNYEITNIRPDGTGFSVLDLTLE